MLGRFRCLGIVLGGDPCIVTEARSSESRGLLNCSFSTGFIFSTKIGEHGPGLSCSPICLSFSSSWAKNASSSNLEDCFCSGSKLCSWLFQAGVWSTGVLDGERKATGGGETTEAIKEAGIGLPKFILTLVLVTLARVLI